MFIGLGGYRWESGLKHTTSTECDGFIVGSDRSNRLCGKFFINQGMY
jgi:hypothetical protein